MLTITEAAVTVVGAEARQTLQTIDNAYASNLRMAADAVEALTTSGLPAIQSQRLVENFNESFDNAVKWRRSVTSSIAKLQVIHKHSNQAETSGGCPRPWDFFTTGKDESALSNEPVPSVTA